MTPALEFKKLSLRIGGKQILDSVSLALEAGRITALVGRSGSGKSMTALAAMRLAPAAAETSGEILLGGADMLRKSEKDMCALRGRDIAMVFQEPMTALNPLQTIGAQVAETILIHDGVSRDQARTKAAGILARVGLPPDRIAPSRFPHELSGGQRQRVVIAIAVALQPKVLIADEPTTALDVTTQAQILALLRRLTREDDTALLLITHNLAVVSDMADRIAVMNDGRIVEEHAPDGFFRDRLSNATNGLVARPIVRELKDDPTGAPVLKADRIVCDYQHAKQKLFSPPARHRAVDGVSLALRKGENIGLVGESGCGKSTLARALLGLHRAGGGSVDIAGEAFPSRDKTAMRRARRSLQIVFQDPYSSFNPRQKIARIIAEPFHLYDHPPSATEKRDRVQDVLQAVGLAPGDAEKYPHEFSGGQRQRIAIARALATQPAVIILDEATSALDISARNRVLDLLMTLSDERGVSYLFITHDLSVVRDVTDRVLVMQAGRIIEEGPTAEIFDRPQNAYTQALINAAPQIKWPANASG